jgi:hypothetical protein
MQKQGWKQPCFFFLANCKLQMQMQAGLQMQKANCKLQIANCKL